MARKERTEDELRQASDHLNYEWEMLRSTADTLKMGGTGDRLINFALRNALLESFLVHARSLILVFYSDSCNPDDVIAEDFIADGDKWKKIRPVKSALLDRTRKRANKLLAHLSYQRKAMLDEQRDWHLVEIKEAIERVIHAFLQAVPDSVLGPRWDASKQSKKAQGE